MRDYTQVQVLRGAVHIVNPRAGRLSLSEAELELPPDVSSFLGGHVTQGLGDPQASAARFVVSETGRAGDLCRQLLRAGEDFTSMSSALAQLLYSSSLGDNRISDGTLCVVLCRAERRRFVSLLKLEPSDAYRTDETDVDGLRRISLALAPDILPSVRERIQKAAFVRTTRGADYHMLLVDRQRAGEVVSRFFVQDFLGAELFLDDVRRTEAFYKAVVNAQNEVSADLTPEEVPLLRRYVNGQVVADHANVPTFVQGLPVRDEIRDRFRERIAAALPDQDFRIDSGITSRLVRYTRYQGDNGLTVRIPAQFHDDLVSMTPPGPDGYWDIRIRTQKWQQG